MKLTVPHLGYIDIFFGAMSREVGPEFVFPPKTSQRTLYLGMRYSPESTGLPFKFILGNFIEALERGADTIAMIMDRGPCRVEMYDVIMQQILPDWVEFLLIPRLVNLHPKSCFCRCLEAFLETIEQRKDPWGSP